MHSLQEHLSTFPPTDVPLAISGEYVTFGLGAGSKNGTWQTFERNLSADLSAAEPGNSLLEVNQLLFRGAGRLDAVSLR